MSGERTQEQVVIEDPNFNEAEFYHTEVKPLVEQLFAKCRERKLPVLIKVEYQRGKDEDGDDSTKGSLGGSLPGARTSPRLRTMAKIGEEGIEAILPALLSGMLGK